MRRVSALLVLTAVLALPAAAGADFQGGLYHTHGPQDDGAAASTGGGGALLPIVAMLTLVAAAGLVLVTRNAGARR